MSKGRFAGRVAIIFGGAQGMGEASARLMRADGAQLVLGDIQAEKGAAVAASLEGDFLETDVRESAQVDRLVDFAVTKHGRIDIVVHCPGTTNLITALNLSDAEWRSNFRLNLDGVFYATRAAGKIMVAQKRGAMVHISSMAAILPPPDEPAYGAAKAGVIAFTKAAAAELGPSGIRVNCVCPGVIETPMVKGVLDRNPDIREAINLMYPLRRVGTAEDIAHLVAFLASDESSFITGQAISIDGGMTLGNDAITKMMSVEFKRTGFSRKL